MLVPICYLVGDATLPMGGGPNVVIAHVCNDAGRFGAGFAGAIAKRYPEVQRRFLLWSGGIDSGTPTRYELGAVQWVRLARAEAPQSLARPSTAPPVRYEGNLWVANMVAQHGVRSARNPHPLDLDSLADCLRKVSVGVSGVQPPRQVHMPRIGTRLAGGRWADIEPLIIERLSAHGVPVFVYDLPKGPNN